MSLIKKNMKITFIKFGFFLFQVSINIKMVKNIIKILQIYICYDMYYWKGIIIFSIYF